MYNHIDLINFISPEAKLLQSFLEKFDVTYYSDEDKLTNYQKLIDVEAHKLASGLNKYQNPENKLFLLQKGFELLFETAKNKRLVKNLDNARNDEAKFFDKYHDSYFTTRLKILIKTYLKLYGNEADLSKLKDMFKTSISGNTSELRKDFYLIFDEYTLEQKRNIEKESYISNKKKFQDYFKNHYEDLSGFLNFDILSTKDPLHSLKQILFYDDKVQNPLSKKEAKDFEFEAHFLLCNYLSFVTSPSYAMPALDEKTKELLPFIDEHCEAFCELDESAKKQLTFFHFTENQNLLEKLLDLKNIQSQQSTIPDIFNKAQQLLKELLILDNQINSPIKTDNAKSKSNFEKTAKDILTTYLEALLSNDRSIIDSHQYSKFFKKLDLEKTRPNPYKIKEITEYFLDKKQYKLSEICDGFLDKPHSQKMLRIKFLGKKITECKSKLEKNSNDMQTKAFDYITLYSLYEAMDRIPSIFLVEAKTFFKDFKSHIASKKYPQDIKRLFLIQFSKLYRDYTKFSNLHIDCTRNEPKELTTIPEDDQLLSKVSPTSPRNKISTRGKFVREKWRILAEAVNRKSYMHWNR